MAKAKFGGLGKGLDALMGEAAADEQKRENAAASAPAVEGQGAVKRPDLPQNIEMDADGGLWVNPALLKPNPHQPRKTFDENYIQELADSIREHGVLSPIIIDDAGEGSFYIIAGECRTRASRAAGLEKVPVVLRHYSEEGKLEVALIENIQRSDLNPVEEAQAYYRLMELGNLSQDEVAKRVGKNRSTVANALRLLKLPEDMQNALVTGQITAGHARALLSVEDATDQRVLFGRIVGQGMSVREAESQAGELNGKNPAVKPKTKKEPPRDPDFAAIEQQLIDALGTKVTLKGDVSHGTVQINYYTKDSLDVIYSRLTKK